VRRDPAATFETARIRAVRGDPSGALSALDEVLAEQPRHLGALLLKAHVRLEARDTAEALALSREAAESHPGSAEALNAVARCLHALGRDEEALGVARRACALLGEGENYRQVAPVYLTIVWCLREMRRYREALAAAEEALARTPDAVLAQWASVVEEELAEAEKDEC
jgi:tetratricopeptide (TPR) repeat protein